MTKVPILVNHNWTHIAGSVDLGPELEQILAQVEHLVISPIIKGYPDGRKEVIAYSIYPPPVEPVLEKKKRGRPKNPNR